MLNKDSWLSIFLECRGDTILALRSVTKSLFNLFTQYRQPIESQVVTTFSSEMQIVATKIMPNNILRLPSSLGIDDVRVADFNFRYTRLPDGTRQIVIETVENFLKPLKIVVTTELLLHNWFVTIERNFTGDLGDTVKIDYFEVIGGIAVIVVRLFSGEIMCSRILNCELQDSFDSNQLLHLAIPYGGKTTAGDLKGRAEQLYGSTIAEKILDIITEIQCCGTAVFGKDITLYQSVWEDFSSLITECLD